MGGNVQSAFLIPLLIGMHSFFVLVYCLLPKTMLRRESSSEEESGPTQSTSHVRSPIRSPSPVDQRLIQHVAAPLQGTRLVEDVRNGFGANDVSDEEDGRQGTITLTRLGPLRRGVRGSAMRRESNIPFGRGTQEAANPTNFSITSVLEEYVRRNVPTASIAPLLHQARPAGRSSTATSSSATPATAERHDVEQEENGNFWRAWRSAPEPEGSRVRSSPGYFPGCPGVIANIVPGGVQRQGEQFRRYPYPLWPFPFYHAGEVGPTGERAIERLIQNRRIIVQGPARNMTNEEAAIWNQSRCFIADLAMNPAMVHISFRRRPQGSARVGTACHICGILLANHTYHTCYANLCETCLRPGHDTAVCREFHLIARQSYGVDEARYQFEANMLVTVRGWLHPNDLGQ